MLQGMASGKLQQCDLVRCFRELLPVPDMEKKAQAWVRHFKEIMNPPQPLRPLPPPPRDDDDMGIDHAVI